MLDMHIVDVKDGIYRGKVIGLNKHNMIWYKFYQLNKTLS